MSTWSISIILGGLDVSDRLTGEVSIDAESSAARQANFVMLPSSGTISPGDWVNTVVVIDHIEDPAGANVVERIFTGFVNRSDYDPVDGTVAFSCTDNLQGHFEAMTESQILTAITDGKYSSDVFGDRRDGWSQALDVLSTVTKDYDLDRDGITATLTDWASNPVPDFNYNESTIIDESVQLELIRLRDLINKVVITSNYRFTRLHHRQHRFTYSAESPGDAGFQFCSYFADSYELPTRDMIQSAAEGAGWLIRGGEINFEGLPDTGSYTCSGGPVGWAITEELQNQLVVDAEWFASRRWSQTITENYTLTVQESGSIAQHGDFIYEDQADSTTKFDDAGWDASNESQIPAGFTQNIIDDYVQDQDDRVVSANTIETLLQVADVKIKDSHRRNFVTWRVPLESTIERSQTVEMQGSTLHARGKVFQYIHLMDLDSGQETTEVKIAISTCWPGGSQDTLTAPAVPDSQPTHPMPNDGTALPNRLGNDDSVPDFDENWEGFTGDFTIAKGSPTDDQKYQRRFRIVTPDIETESRDNVDVLDSQTYETLCVADLLSITIAETGQILVNDSNHGQVADNIDFITDAVISVDSADHGYTVDNVTVALPPPLSVNDSEHSHAVDNVDLTQDSIISVDDAVNSHTVDNSLLLLGVTLSADDVLHGHTSDADVFESYHDSVNNDFPVGYWRLGESSGTTAFNEVPGNDGAYLNTPTLNQPGAIANDSDTSVLFTASNSESITVPDYVAAQDIFSGGGSIEMWLFANTVNNGGLLSKDNGSTAGWFSQSIPLGGSYQVRFLIRATGDVGAWDTTAGLSTGVWNHVVITYDNGSLSNVPITYVNGVAVATTAIVSPTGTISSDVGAQFRIGALESGVHWWDGRMDEVVVYDSVLLPARILERYNKGLGI